MEESITGSTGAQFITSTKSAVTSQEVSSTVTQIKNETNDLESSTTIKHSEINALRNKVDSMTQDLIHSIASRLPLIVSWMLNNESLLVAPTIVIGMTGICSVGLAMSSAGNSSVEGMLGDIGMIICVIFLMISTLAIMANDQSLDSAIHKSRRKIANKFKKNKVQIDKTADQLLIVLKELQKKTDSTDDWDNNSRVKTSSIGILYQWWVAADLPMNGTMHEIFKYEIKKRKIEESEAKKKRESKELTETAYSDEVDRIEELLKTSQKAIDHKPSRITKNRASFVYTGDDLRVAGMVDRVNKISHEMEDIESGSGQVFMAEMKIPLESLSRMIEVSNDDKSEIVQGMIAKSLSLFDERLSYEEAKIAGSKRDEISREYKTLEGLLS